MDNFQLITMVFHLNDLHIVIISKLKCFQLQIFFEKSINIVLEDGFDGKIQHLTWHNLLNSN